MRTTSPPTRSPFRTIVLGMAIAALCGVGAGVTARADEAAAASHQRGFSIDHVVTPHPSASAEVRARYGQLPLSFEANHGQSDSRVSFLSRGSGYSLFLAASEAVLVLSQSEAGESRKASRAARTTVGAGQRKSAVVRMTLVNANRRAKAAGHDALPGTSHYLIGDDPAKWRTNIPTYARVRYEGVYPGIDLVYYGNQGRLEYDFVVAPGADPRRVTLAFEGARDVHIDARGELVLGVEGGEVRQHKPVVYQETAGVKREVAGRYVMKGPRQVGFRIGAYDPSRPLIIDPVLVYSTFLGGSATDFGVGVAVDGAGNAYVTGYTISTDFPTTAGAAQTSHAGGDYDAFVTKLNATGSGLVYSTYLGGSEDDLGSGIAVDGAGNAYVTGYTRSIDFPTTAGAAQTTPAGDFDTFVAKMNPTGSGLVYSTYLGGSAQDWAFDIALDAGGSVYVAGPTDSVDFPTTAGAVQTTSGGGLDTFVTKLNPTGSGRVYSTYLGGNANDWGSAIALDAAGSAYVVGPTDSTDFPVTAGAVQTTYAGGANDVFVTRLNATGSALVFSTYLGGSNEDVGLGVAIDGAGTAYLTGWTWSTDFPTTTGAAQTVHAGATDAFVIKLDAAGAALVYSTFLGGNVLDLGSVIGVDDAGSAYVSGSTTSTTFPTTAGAIQTTYLGFGDAFVTKVDPTGSGLVYSTYLGGSSDDFVTGIAVDGAGSAYVTGLTLGGSFPTTTGAVQTTHAGAFDAFVFKLATLPTSREQCKNGGWKTFGVFRNQGDCVSFVASRGRNPPSGP